MTISKSYPFFFLFIFSCSLKPNINSTHKVTEKVNNKFNNEYKRSINGKFGKLSQNDLHDFYLVLESSFNIKIDTTKNLLINYFQKGKNCIAKSGNDKYEKKVFKSYKEASDKAVLDYNAINLLVYNKDSYFKEYAPNSGWIEDTGFIKKNIFTQNENCSGFFILRTDGKFYKYYGEDYFSIVRRLLSAKYWDYPEELKN